MTLAVDMVASPPAPLLCELARAPLVDSAPTASEGRCDWLGPVSACNPPVDGSAGTE